MSAPIYLNARFLTQKTTGVQRFAIEISKQLTKINPNIRLVAPANIIHQELALELNVITFGKLSGHLWEQVELPFFLKTKGSPLLINFCNTAPILYQNQIVTIHDLAFIVNPKWFSKKFAAFYNFLIPKIARSSKHIFTVSNSSKREICDLLQINQDKVSVVYNGVTFKTISDNINTETLFPERYFLTVSSIDPRKNLQKLIQAFEEWAPKDIKLLVIGGNNHNFANQQVKYGEQIIPLGYVTDKELINYYQNAVCFVYPSLYEGFGLPPLEALALGTNVIASNILSIKEVCGEHVLMYFDPYNKKNIIEALQFALNNTESPKPIDLSKFSWEKAAEAIALKLKTFN